jgi:NAD(P)-dependent dehydrogenase (short-subunit alcohol dehydrogenase family)
MTERLSGLRAVITGGASGIGLATARRFAAEGAAVCVGDLNETALEAAATEIGASGLARVADVTRADSLHALLETAADRFGGIDCVVCNAGVDVAGTVAATSEEHWDLINAVVAKGTFLTARAAWPHLVDAGGGSVLATASICSTWAVPGDAAYCAAKAGVLMLMKCLALEGAEHGIRANSVCPGFTDTPMLQDWFAAEPDPAAARRAVAELQPLRRMGRPEDHAAAFAFLASPDAEWITGAALTIDGGLTVGMTASG